MGQPKENSQNVEATPISMAGLVSQLEDLVRLALECEKKDLAPDFSFVEVNKQLVKLREAIEILHQSYIQTLNSFSLTEEDVSKFRKNIEETKGPEKKLFDTLNHLQGVCEEARAKLYVSLQENREQVRDMEAELLDKNKKSRRKGKFKSIGGKKGWMPT